MDGKSQQHEYCTGGFDPDDIVISGMSGRFPASNSVGELADAIYQKKELVIYSDVRYEKGVGGAPYQSCGIVNDLDKLDADYFCITPSNAGMMTPSVRKNLEVSYEAIADAGYDPFHLKKKFIGVYAANTNDDAERIIINQGWSANLNLIRAMIANRTTFSLDFQGPSYTIDSACSSSAIALWTACNDIREGRVEAAVVSGTQLNMAPDTLQSYMASGIASKGGNSIPFDARSDGMIRTEGIAALFVQKARFARRVYTTVKTRFLSAGQSPEGISVPSYHHEIRLMRELLQEANITTDDVNYVEAHGTGTLVGDPIELNAIAEVFCENRNRPLYMGSIKSNIGHTEACSAICGMVNATLAFEREMIPTNNKYEVPNPGSQPLVDGKLVVVNKPTPFIGDYIYLHSLGFGGTLVGFILKKNPIQYKETKTPLAIPRMIFFPATTEEAIAMVFDYIKNHPNLRHEFFALLHQLAYTPVFLKPQRGYALFQNVENMTTEIKNIPPGKRQVWFVMTGMGCQWSGMGLQLMKIDVFAESMKKSAATLKPYGIDLFEILRADKNHLEVDRSITPAFVAICAIQIALIDLVTFLDIIPDGIVGHSTGELLCAYADGCCTAEETILSALWRGKAVEASNLPRGGMAAVGMSWKDAERLCPEGIYPACDNADDSVTISGSEKSLVKFVEKLQGDSVFARVVNAYGYAFHSSYVHPAAPVLREALQKIIKDPKPRSEKWVSSSYPESEWDHPDCKMATAEYFVHNLMSCVRFNDAIKKIPSDAITIEIGPHFLLQSILKRGIGSKASYIGLMKRNEPDNVKHFLNSVGKLYLEGLDPKIDLLYPAVKFPVPRGTPMISDLIRWNYSHTFPIPKFTPMTGEFIYEVVPDKTEAYLLDHRIDGKSLFPATGYVHVAWRALAAKVQKGWQELPIVIKNMKIHRATFLNPQTAIFFRVNIMDSSGHFEITEGKSIVASGDIFECKKMVFDEPPPEYKCDDYSSVSGKELYNELKMSGYEYGPVFQGLIETNMEGTAGLVLWQDKWIPFLDSLLLFFGLLNNNKDFCLPTGALAFKIDPNVMTSTLQQRDRNEIDVIDPAITTRNMPVTYNPRTGICRSVGVEICKLDLDPAPRRGKEEIPTLERCVFIPYTSDVSLPDKLQQTFSHYMHALNETMNEIENRLGNTTKSLRFPVQKDGDFCLEDYLSNLSEEQRLLKILKNAFDSSTATKKKEQFVYYDRSIGNDLLNTAMVNEDSLRIVFEIISENTFRKLSVVEINNRSFPVVLLPLIDILQKYSHMKFKKSILIAPKTLEVDVDVLEKLNVQRLTDDSMEALSGEKSQDVAISSFTSGTEPELQKLLDSLTSVLKSNGFILLFFKGSVNPAEKLLASVCGEELTVLSYTILEKTLQDKGLVTLSKLSDSFGGYVYLLRAATPAAPHKVVSMTEGSYGWVEELKKSVMDKESGTIWLVSQDSPISGIVGLVNCLKQEPGGEKVRCVFISKKRSEDNIPPFNLEHPFYSHLQAKNLTMNLWSDGSWGSIRHLLIREAKPMRKIEHSYVDCRKFGDLSSFEWKESQVRCSAALKKQILVHIYYSGLNFRDVMLATGKLSIGTVKVGSKDAFQSDGSVLGLEYCGKDEAGNRICGFVRSRGMATSTLVDPHEIINIPDHWSLEEAATVPVVYGTCYYALIMRAKLQPRERILVHSATGGIGLAAITLALHMNCEVFATVGNDEKRKYLKQKFPQIKDENIGCSRNTSFKNMIFERTNGKGVDVLLNSLADDKFEASLQCMADCGRYVEIGKYDLSLDRKIGLKMFLRDITFHGVFLDRLTMENEVKANRMMEIMGLVREGIRTGVVQPLDRTVFGKDEVEKAFRYMAKGVHVGKVLLKIRDEEPDIRAIPRTLMLPAIPNTYFYENKVYIVIGGIGGFGIEVTKWLISRGAKNIILTSRYGERTPYHYLCLKRWNREGANVQVSTLNVAVKSEAEQLLQEASRIGQVGGILNSAVVLKDAFMDMQNPENYREVCAPKATATKYLDELSRKLCPSLDYFICFSSISCGRGNAGQTNYGYANSVMERICEERRKIGLHGLAIEWGIIGEVGVVHRHMGDEAMISGVMAQSVSSCLETLDAFCIQDCPVVTSYVTAAAAKKSTQGDTLAQIVKALGMNDISEINTSRNFNEMGIDSMVGVEIKQMVESYCDISLTMQEIQEMKIGDVKDLFAKADAEKTSSQAPALFATTSIKLPQTLVHTEPLIVLNKINQGSPVFILNIGDTDVTDFQYIADSISRPVYVLVWTSEAPTTDMESLATWYLKLIKETVNCPFHLIGHSLGGSVAFEIALQAQKANINVLTITLLDGSKDLSYSLNKEEETEVQDIEVTALCRFVEQFQTIGASRLEDQLAKTLGLEQRIKTVLTYLTSSSTQTVNKNEVAEAISIYLEKLQLVKSYGPSEKLSKSVNLIEDPMVVLANDVTLLKEYFSEVCSGKVSIHRIFCYEELTTTEGVEKLAGVLQTII